MAVKIRLRRMGSRGKPFYRMVVADSRSPRDGRFIDTLGYYNPGTDPATIKIDEEKALLWLGRGAQPTDTAEALLKKESILEKFQSTKKSKSPAEAATAAVAVEEEAEKPAKAPARKRRTKAVQEPEAVAAEPEIAAEPEVTAEEQPTEEQG